MSLTFICYAITLNIPVAMFLYAIQVMRNANQYKNTNVMYKTTLFHRDQEEWRSVQKFYAKLLMLVSIVLAFCSAYTTACIERVDTVGNVFVMICVLLLAITFFASTFALTNAKMYKSALNHKSGLSHLVHFLEAIF